MEKAKEKLPKLSEWNHRERALLCVIAGLVVALIVLTCMAISIRMNMQNEYADIRNQIGESLYSDLYMMAQTFDMTAVPNADVKNVVIPQMKNYFIAATALNEQLTRNFGIRYQVLTDADINTLNTTFSTYETAFRSDSPTDLVQTDMQACMQRVRDLLNSRYSEGHLKAGR